VPTIATNTVTWNGALAAGGSVTITVTATITASAAGQRISNQATVHYDSSGDTVNDATLLTDDPAAGGTQDPTEFQVEGIPIPATSGLGLLLLVVGLLALGIRRIVAR
jgi:hypothetical protein